MSTHRVLTKLCRDESAATSSEFALVVPFFLTLIFATVNGSIAMSAVSQLHYAAERPARCLSVDVTGACEGDINHFGNQYYDGPSLTGLNFAASAKECGNEVVGTGSYEILAGLASSSINISATACYPYLGDPP